MFSLLGLSSSILEAYFKARPYILFARACLYENINICKAVKQKQHVDETGGASTVEHSASHLQEKRVSHFHHDIKILATVIRA